MSQAESVHIDTALAQQLVSNQFPEWADLPITMILPGGWDNHSFRLGSTMLVRLPSAARYAAKIFKEQLWLPWLSPKLPLPIPKPIALGKPGFGYPWHWAVYAWLEGEVASAAQITSTSTFARNLANFLRALQAINATKGPKFGEHNFWRGGPLAVYHAQTVQALTALQHKINTAVVTAIWDAALTSAWQLAPVWVHGDISADNLLVQHGKLNAVIDFGGLAVGDPACDLAIAWNFFDSTARSAFRAALELDAATWQRGRGWALWKALIICAALPGTNPQTLPLANRCLAALIDNYKRNL